MTIKQALFFFIASLLAGTTKLTIESDSQIAISWINNVDQRSWDKWTILNQIDALLHSLGNVSIIHTLREGNSFADTLAKYGVDAVSMFSVWW